MKLPDTLKIGEILYQSTSDEVIEYMIVDIDNKNVNRLYYKLEATKKLDHNGVKYTRNIVANWNYTDYFYNIKDAYKRSIRNNKNAIIRRDKKLRYLRQEIDNNNTSLERLQKELAVI
jgi:hypothetical protein